MTREEIKEEITELYGANQALIEAMSQLHKQQMETTKKMFALSNMLREMEGDKNT
jgi:predicted DNA-binding protein (MmcQ/YjbR family)